MAEISTEVNKEIIEEWPTQNTAKFGRNLTASEKTTLCVFAKAYECHCEYIDQNGVKCNGIPKLCEFNQVAETMFSEYSYHLYGIDFKNDEVNTVDECFMVRPNIARSDECPFLHKVKNRIVKGSECPFIATVSVGKHNHPPPPPYKTPYNIKNQLQNIINNEHTLDLTRRKFLTGTMIQNYLNGKQLSELHPSLNNQSKIDYYIGKTRRSQYPYGQNILGVTHEFMKHEKSEDPYIRSIRFLDSGQYIVVCATKQQLKAIPELTYFEIDMAFKRIHGVTNEWEVSAYVSRIQKTLTFARIFTNIETADAYQNLFEDLFNCIEKDTGEIFNFYHIHGRGLGCIIADQHKGQALGLGRYLNSKYPNLTPVEHLQHIYKLCQVHYKRNIDKNKQISSEIRSAMYLVPTLDAQKEVLIVLDKIQSSGELGAEAWVKDKRVSWVLSGISIAFTKMDHIIWNQTPNNTNVGESAHANVNHDGRNLSLLAGIVRGCNFDKRQWESGNVYEKYNIPESYRDKSELARSIQAEKRAAKKQSAACSK
ncbi:uncharacterized protein OCT59_027121 [Rhizophagus irregularis]|nr:hypothetical protein OCT59_027121 [Rhizophagus irregularis]